MIKVIARITATNCPRLATTGILPRYLPDIIRGKCQTAQIIPLIKHVLVKPMAVNRFGTRNPLQPISSPAAKAMCMAIPKIAK